MSDTELPAMSNEEFDRMIEGENTAPETQVDNVQPEQVEQVAEPAIEPQQQELERIAPTSEPERQPTTVPVSALIDERLKRQREADRAERLQQDLREYQRQVEELKRPKEAPDFFADPDAAFKANIQQYLSPITQQYEARLQALARSQAETAFGRDVVKTAAEAFDEAVNTGAIDPYSARSVMDSINPHAAAVDWYKRQQVLKTVGDDPAAYQEKLLSDPEFLRKAAERLGVQPQAQAPTSVIRGPQPASLPSVSKMGAAPVATRTTGSLAPYSDEEFEEVLNHKARR